jgi:hypothetical protein
VQEPAAQRCRYQACDEKDSYVLFLGHGRMRLVENVPAGKLMMQTSFHHKFLLLRSGMQIAREKGIRCLSYIRHMLIFFRLNDADDSIQ